jgi:hypothetical protein
MMEQSMLSLFTQFSIAKAFFKNASEPVMIKILSVIKKEIDDDDDYDENSPLQLAYDNLASLLGQEARSNAFKKLLPYDRFPFVLNYNYEPKYHIVRYCDGVLIDSLRSFMAWYTNLNQYRKTYVLEKTSFALQTNLVGAVFGFDPDLVAVEGSDDMECWLHNEPLTPEHMFWEGFSSQWTSYFDFADEVSIALAFISGVMMEGVFYPECCFQGDIHYPNLDTKVYYGDNVWYRFRQCGAKYEETLCVPTYYFEEPSLAHVFYPSADLCDIIRVEMGEHAALHRPSFHYSSCHMNDLDFNAGGPVENAYCACPTITNRVYHFEHMDILKMYVYDDEDETDEEEEYPNDDDVRSVASYHSDDGKVKIPVLEPTDTRFDHYGEDWPTFGGLTESQ